MSVHPLRLGLLTVLLAACWMLGACASGHLPRDRYRVGGGFEIHYRAAVPGTLVWADRANGRVWATHSLATGESFTTTTQLDDASFRNAVGKLADTRPVLYFVPDRNRH